MKIFINFKQPDEDAECDAVIDAIRSALKSYEISRIKTDIPDNHSFGTHSSYRISNMKHREI